MMHTCSCSGVFSSNLAAQDITRDLVTSKPRPALDCKFLTKPENIIFN